LNKILLIRFSSIGDIVLTTPVVRVLKTQLDCELHVLTKEKFAFLYEHNPYVDQVHTIQKGVDEVLPELKTIDFDFIVDLQKNLRSSRIKNTLDAPSASFITLSCCGLSSFSNSMSTWGNIVGIITQSGFLSVFFGQCMLL